MLKKLSIFLMTILLSACSLSSYIPFVDSKKPVIDLNKDQIDQKSYAVAYESTIKTYKSQVKSDYDINSFASGVNDWYLDRILVPLDQVKTRLSQGVDSNVHAYYSGVVFASELQNNFSRLSTNCWSQIDRPSITQGIYDAMIDIQKDKIRNEDDEYIVKGSEVLLSQCK